MRTRYGPVLAIALALVVGACTGSGAGASASPAAPAAAPSRAVPPARLYDPTADAGADVLAGIAAAKADGKLVLVDFGADWCPDCHVLSAYLHGAAGKALVDASFHVVAVDVGYWDHNLDVVKLYGNAIGSGIPALVVLNGDGKVLRSTADGSLASAASMSEADVLAVLASLVE